MSRNSRRRHADKKRAHAQDHRTAPPRGEPAGKAAPAPGPSAADALRTAVLLTARGLPPDWAGASFTTLPSTEQMDAIEAFVATNVGVLISGGWTPTDLREITRRRADPTGSSYLLDHVATVTARHPSARVDPRWQAQLDDARARPVVPLRRWIGDRKWDKCRNPLVALCAAILGLPRLETVLPPPGSATTAFSRPSGIDPAVLRRVRGLLAKAESTEFADEAEALSAKAQQLMARYSIDVAMAQAPTTGPAVPLVRRIWLDAPYVLAKAHLIAAVAQANRSRVVVSDKLGFVTAVGFETDIDSTELLSISLLIQATRAMRASGSRSNSDGTSRTRSFRQSFLLAYADRIGERLSESRVAAEAEAGTEHGGAVLPILASRAEQVDNAFDEAFPSTIAKPTSIRDAEGWRAGRVAADLADLGVRDSVEGRSA